MKKITINYKDKDLIISSNMMSRHNFKELYKKPFYEMDWKDDFELTVFLYCMIHSNKNDIAIDFNEFLEYIDDNPTFLVECYQKLFEDALKLAEKEISN